MSQLSIFHKRNLEDDKIVRSTVKLLKADNYTIERLNCCLQNCKDYESKGHKTRANKNLIAAVEILLIELL